LTGPVGPRGLTILVIVGIAGLLLAFLGWSQRGAGPAASHPDRSTVRIVSSSVR
jgi:hypothetical protein